MTFATLTFLVWQPLQLCFPLTILVRFTPTKGHPHMTPDNDPALSPITDAGHVRTIDITPTWRGVLRLLVTVANDAETATARANAWIELERMADLADAYVAEHQEAGQ